MFIVARERFTGHVLDYYHDELDDCKAQVDHTIPGAVYFLNLSDGINT